MTQEINDSRLSYGEEIVERGERRKGGSGEKDEDRESANGID